MMPAATFGKWQKQPKPKGGGVRPWYHPLWECHSGAPQSSTSSPPSSPQSPHVTEQGLNCPGHSNNVPPPVIDGTLIQ